MQKFADKLSGYFVPTVVLISIVTWIIWLVIGFTDITLLRKKFDVSVLYSEKTEGRNFNRRDEPIVTHKKIGAARDKRGKMKTR